MDAIREVYDRAERDIDLLLRNLEGKLDLTVMEEIAKEELIGSAILIETAYENLLAYAKRVYG